MDYDALNVGHEFPPDSFVLKAGAMAKYLEAVGGQSYVYQSAPPTALAALVLKTLIDKLYLPPGAVHTSQELEVFGPAYVGEPLVCQAQVVQNSLRGGRRFMTVEFRVARQGGTQVLEGRTSLILPF